MLKKDSLSSDAVMPPVVMTCLSFQGSIMSIAHNVKSSYIHDSMTIYGILQLFTKYKSQNSFQIQAVHVGHERKKIGPQK